MINRYSTILFDADDTLFDYGAAESAALTKVLRENGIRCSDETVKRFKIINAVLWQKKNAGKLNADELQAKRFETLFNYLGIERDTVSFNRRFLEELGKNGVLFPEALSVCKELFSRGIRLYILTNGLSISQRTRLSLSKIEPYISDIFISEEIGLSKPDKALYEYVLKNIGLTDRARVIVIGDSPETDIIGGKSAGIDTCWINRKNLYNAPSVAPTFEIRSLNEISSLISY